MDEYHEDQLIDAIADAVNDGEMTDAEALKLLKGFTTPLK